MDADFFRQLESERTSALVARHLATLERLHAPNYQLVTPAGQVMLREQYLGAIAQAPFYRAWELGDIEVRTSPLMAVLRYRARLTLASGTVVDCWHTDSYESNGAEWQAVWSQATKILSSQPLG